MSDYEDLEVGEDMRFQRGDWKRERVGWVVMWLLVVAGLIGAFGHGALTYRTADERDGFEVGYESVSRRGGTTGVHVKVSPEAIEGDTIDLRISTSFLRHVTIESIVPEPDGAVVQGEGVVYQFAVGDERPTADVAIRFDIRPDTLGFLDSEFELVGHSSVELRQFLLP